MTNSSNNKKMSYNQIGSLIFVGCMFAGMGVGFLMNNLVPAMFIGMGVGFVFKALLYMRAKEEGKEINHPSE